MSAQMKDHSFGKKYYARVQLTEGKTFAEATGHATEGTLRDWMQFDRKENKSCVVEQPRKEQKNVNSKNGVQEALLDYRVIKGRRKNSVAGYHAAYRTTSSDPCAAGTSRNAYLRGS